MWDGGSEEWRWHGVGINRIQLRNKKVNLGVGNNGVRGGGIFALDIVNLDIGFGMLPIG